MTGPIDDPGARARPESPDEGQAFLSLLGWPPPGLGRIQADLWLVARRMWVAGAVLVLPLVFVIAVPQSPMGLGPLGGAWWIALVTTLVGVVLFADAVVALVRMMSRARRAILDGYSPFVVGLVLSDRGRDGGFLFQGAQVFSTMTSDQRTALTWLRIVGPVLYLLAALWLTAGFGALVLIAARGFGSHVGVGLWTGLPTLLLAFLGLMARATEGTLLRRARIAWYKEPWSADLARKDVSEWREAAEQRGLAPATYAASRTPKLLALTSALVLVLAAVTVVPPITLVPVSSVGAVFGSVAGFTYTRTFERMVRTEPYRSLRLAPDSSIGTAEAGDLLNVIVNVGDTRPREEGLRAPLRAYEDDWVPPSPVEEWRTDYPPFWTDSLWVSLEDGFSDAELEFLRAVEAHPARDELRRLARAPAVDALSGQFVVPFADDATFWTLPFPRTRALRDAAYTHIGVAALYVAEGRYAEAEEAAREVISFGLLLMDDSPTLIGNLIGAVVTSLGGEALVRTLRASGRADRADQLAESAAAADRAVAQVAPVLRRELGPEEYLASLPDLVENPDIPRGLRWEHLNMVATIAPCVNLRRVVFGPGEEYGVWLDGVRSSLVRYPSEVALFDIASRGFVFDENPGFILRVLSVAMRSVQTRGSCSQLVNGLINFM